MQRLGLPAQRTEMVVQALESCSDPDEERRLREELITINMEVAASIASRYRDRGIPGEDLHQVAYLALTRASRRFDPRTGHSFLAFCVPSVRGEIRRHFRDHGWMIRPPRRLQELRMAARPIQAEMVGASGQEPNASDLAARLDANISEVREALRLHEAYSPSSLDAPLVGEESRTALGDVIASEADAFATSEARMVLVPLLRQLGERERRILHLRFFEDLTQREIGERVGITQMQVSRVLTRTFRELRQTIESRD